MNPLGCVLDVELLGEIVVSLSGVTPKNIQEFSDLISVEWRKALLKLHYFWFHLLLLRLIQLIHSGHFISKSKLIIWKGRLAVIFIENVMIFFRVFFNYSFWKNSFGLEVELVLLRNLSLDLRRALDMMTSFVILVIQECRFIIDTPISLKRLILLGQFFEQDFWHLN